MNGPRIAPVGDGATREIAQCEFTRPVVVEAGAGTGKTALLVARVAAWCVGDGWLRHSDGDDRGAVAREVLNGVVAITFTEAAAAEMATRIGEALTDLARAREPVGWVPGRVLDGLDGDQVAARAADLCAEIHRLSVTTIHSFCQRVLAAHPFEAGLHPHFEIDADGAQLEALVDEVVEEGLRELDDSPLRGEWERLAVRGIGPAKIAEALRQLVAAGTHADDLDRDPFDREAATLLARGLADDLSAFFAVEQGRLAEVPGVKLAAHARESVARLAEIVGALPVAPEYVNLVEAVGVVDGPALDRLKKWSKDDWTKKALACVGADREEVVAATERLVTRLKSLVDLDLEGFGAARTLLLSLLAEVDSRRRVRGLVTFSDLLELTARLFDTHEEVCRSERRRMDQFLVDEFQDTDDVQCRMVEHLALEGAEDERPGLFVVGDPKQSIYAWRSADLAAYDGFVDLVLNRGGVRGSLTRNFRSVQPILDEVERVVEPVMHEKHGFQPVFEALEATGDRVVSPGFDQPPWSAVEHWVCWHPGEDGVLSADKQKTGPTTRLEAEAIASDIRRMHDEAGVPFGDVAVLLRATTAQGELLEAFREWGVPFEVAREREYFRQREIIEAAALVRAVLEPADTLALLTVLRSDAVGVPDIALAPLWDAGLPAVAAVLNGADAAALAAARRVVDIAVTRIEPAPGSELLPNWPDALAGALDNLAELRRSMREDPPGDFVERLRTLWLAEVSAGARRLGRFRQARLDGFYTDLDQTLSRSAGGSAELARFLRRAVEEGREAPTVSEPDRDADAVHVMTIYGAKGLDFKHVYLAQIHKRTGGFGSGPQAVMRRHEGTVEFKLFGWPTPNLARAENRRELQARAERVRLLYVAMTRAKQRLVVSGGWATPGETTDPLQASTLAEVIAHRGDPALIGDLIERGVDRAADPEPGVSWVIPALGERSGASGSVIVERCSSVADDQTVAADADDIAKARASAAGRMAARWSTPASDSAHRSIARMETEIDEDAVSAPSPSRRSAAAAVGTAVHDLLETLDLESDLAAQVIERRPTVIESAAAGLDPGMVVEMTGRLEEVVDRLVESACLRRLGEVAEAVIARELPVFLRPTEDSGTSVISGAVDLVYRDPEDGRLVIADYKTDGVETDAEIAERTERYRSQLETYASALEEALVLDYRPRAELWFLHADRIVRIAD
jgi:ATP-dependent exoDNAse (exonuclease V) beta subunit